MSDMDEHKATMTTDMSFKDYASAEGLNATAIKAGRLSMLHMRNTITGHAKKDTSALAWGRLVHAVILEPERVLASIAVWTGPKKVGKIWEEFKEEHAEMEIVTVEERDELTDVVLAVNRNKTASRMISETIHEACIFWDDKLLGKCKARLDGVSQSVGIIDVKTTGRIDQRSFGRQFFDMGYDFQFGWYHEGTSRCEMYGDLPSHCIVVDSGEDHDVYVVRVQDDVVKEGAKKAREIGMRYRACQAVGSYPGVANGIDVVPLEVPAWIGLGAAVPVAEMEATEL